MQHSFIGELVNLPFAGFFITMGFVVDLIGKKFGRLLVLEQVKERTKGRQVKWECKCDCGKICFPLGNHLKSGHTKSCGCFAIEKTIIVNTKHGYGKRGEHPEYKTWGDIKYRCYNPEYPEFEYYGGRGIVVCDRWLDKQNGFLNFLEDMGKKPSAEHSIDRYPNVNGNYEPANCRWATPKQQGGNKRNNKWIEYNGIKMIQADWAKYLGATQQNLHSMLKNKTFEHAYEYYMSKERPAGFHESILQQLRNLK
jgi:hypothetical protein